MTFPTRSNQSTRLAAAIRIIIIIIWALVGWCRGLVEWIFELPRAMPVTIYDTLPYKQAEHVSGNTVSIQDDASIVSIASLPLTS